MRRKKGAIVAAVAAVGVWLSSTASSEAHIVINSPGPETGISYEWLATAHHAGSGSFSGSVGAKSWAEPGQPVGEKGWTHTTDWVALDLNGLTDPHWVTVQLGRGGTGQLFPAFSLYQGWETVNSDATNHTFHNTGNISWATNLTYLDHVANAGGPLGTASGVGSEVVAKSFFLAPGLYSLVLGGNPSFDLGQTGQHGFWATLTVSEVPVPAAVWLFGSGVTGIIALARRKMTA